jgi:hypothetical protein
VPVFSALLVLLALSGGGRGGQSPTLVLDHTGSARDITIAFRGAGYTPGAEVTVALGENAIPVAITTANAKGRISGVFPTPDPRLIPELAGTSALVYAIETGSGIRSTEVQLSIARAGRTAGSQHQETAVFALELEIGKAPEDATYWVLFGAPGSQPSARRLTDPEGDGVYSLSMEVGAGVPLAIELVRGTGTRNTSAGPSPDQPIRTIRKYPPITPRVSLMLRLATYAGR